MKQIMPRPAETMRQARTWENVKNRYINLGLCDKCAAQAAWGHQTHADSWTELSPPCQSCAPIVASFDSPTPSAIWRKMPQGSRADRTHQPDHWSTLADAGIAENDGLWIGCGGCESRWTGLAAAHCAGCHLTFTSVSGFDIHRRDGKCLDPAQATTRRGESAFVIADRVWHGWSLPGTWDGPQ